MVGKPDNWIVCPECHGLFVTSIAAGCMTPDGYFGKCPFCQFMMRQEPLGHEFDKILHDNLWDPMVYKEKENQSESS